MVLRIALLIGLIGLSPLVALSAPSAEDGGLPVPPRIDPRADEVLRAFSQHLAGLPGFRVELRSTARLTAAENAPALVRDYTFALRRPNRMAILPADATTEGTVICDGKHLFASLPMLRKYTQDPAPANLDDLQGGNTRAAMIASGLAVAQAVVLFHHDPYTRLRADASQLRYLGSEPVDGTPCDHLLIQSPVLNWEVWIETGKTPWLRKGALSLADQVGAGQAEAKSYLTFRNWLPLDNDKVDLFRFEPPADAQRVERFFGSGPAPASAPAVDVPQAIQSTSQPAGVELTGMACLWVVPGNWQAVAADRTGSVLWALDLGGRVFRVDPRGRCEPAFSITSRATRLRCADLDGDGKSELITFRTWRSAIEAHNSSGQLLWSFGGQREVNDLWPADLDGNGSDELIIACNGRPALTVLDGRGHVLWENSQDESAWQTCTADVDKQAGLEILASSAEGKIRVFSVKGELLNEIDPGCYCFMVRPGAGSRVWEFLVSGRVFPEKEILAALRPGSEARWSLELGASPDETVTHAVLTNSRERLALASRNGTVRVVDPAIGRLLASRKGSARGTQVAWLPTPDGQVPLLVVATGERLSCYRIEAD